MTDYDPCTCGWGGTCSVHPLEQRMARLERLLELPVAVYRDQRIGAHACWYGSLAQWLELEPFVCGGCLQLVSREFARTVLTYTAERVPQGLERAEKAYAAEREAKPTSLYEIALENGRTMLRGEGPMKVFVGGGIHKKTTLVEATLLPEEHVCEKCGRFIHPGYSCEELDPERGG